MVTARSTDHLALNLITMGYYFVSIGADNSTQVPPITEASFTAKNILPERVEAL